MQRKTAIPYFPSFSFKIKVRKRGTSTPAFSKNHRHGGLAAMLAIRM